MKIDHGLFLFYNSSYVAVVIGLEVALLIVLRRKGKAVKIYPRKMDEKYRKIFLYRKLAK